MLYAAWWWTVIAAGFLLGWLAVMTAAAPDMAMGGDPRTRSRARSRRCGFRLSVTGIDRIPRGGAVLAFNHASYMDAVVVAAVLPGEPTYVAKKELAGQIFAGPLLRRLGVLFLERFERRRQPRRSRKRDGGRATQRACWCSFRKAHSRAGPGCPASISAPSGWRRRRSCRWCPGILRGTRSMLRGEQWFPRWSPVSVTIAHPIMPSGTDFASVVQLRDAVRAVVLAGCGEPDLGELIKPIQLTAKTR